MATQRLSVGDIVLIKGGAHRDHYAYVYEEYDRWGNKKDPHGVSIMTDDGSDLGGWSGEEQAQWLEFVEHTDFNYEFKNVMQLSRDKEKIVSVIKEALKKWQ